MNKKYEKTCMNFSKAWLFTYKLDMALCIHIRLLPVFCWSRIANIEDLLPFAVSHAVVTEWLHSLCIQPLLLVSMLSQFMVEKLWFRDFGSQSGPTDGSAAIGALFPLGSLSSLVESCE